MARFLRSVLAEDQTVTAGGSPIQLDLPVNPISYFLVTIRAQTATANALPTNANLLDVFSKIEVTFKGTSIVAATAKDLARLMMHLWRAKIVRELLNDDLNGVTFLTLPVTFTRKPYWQKEAFPATRKGDLKVILTPGSTFTNITAVRLDIETVELLDATPEQFLKYTTFTKTPSAVGDHDVDLPLGNPILGVLLAGTTVPAGASYNSSIKRVKVLVDNVEYGYSASRWESLHNDVAWKGSMPWDMTTLTHLENLAAAYTQNAESGPPSDAVREDVFASYLDFDPLQDESYALDTIGRGRVHLRITADVADEIRVLPVELIKLTTAPGGA